MSEEHMPDISPAEARWTLEEFKDLAPKALAETNSDQSENQTCRLSLRTRNPRGAGHLQNPATADVCYGCGGTILKQQEGPNRTLSKRDACFIANLPHSHIKQTSRALSHVTQPTARKTLMMDTADCQPSSITTALSTLK